MKICKYCKKQFAGTNSQKFCTPSCRINYMNYKRYKINMSTRKCRRCGKEFTPKVHNQDFCSLECQKFKEVKYCIVCGKQLVKNKSKYCSIKCRNEDYKANGHVVGEKVKKPKKTTLADLNEKARAEGLTYGQYMAKYGYKRSEEDVVFFQRRSREGIEKG